MFVGADDAVRRHDLATSPPSRYHKQSKVCRRITRQPSLVGSSRFWQALAGSGRPWQALAGSGILVYYGEYVLVVLVVPVVPVVPVILVILVVLVVLAP